jgi:propionyl-CoA synthetase
MEAGMTGPDKNYAQVYQQSVDHPDTYWAEQAKLIDWHQPFAKVLDYSRAPFAKWFVGGTTNLCYNALDRWAASQPQATALVLISSETNSEKVLTFAELQSEVNSVAAMLKSQDVGKGDRVLIYMPMIGEAIFTMLACARIGAIHSVVFGGFASNSVATRIDDAKPKLILSTDAGSRGGRVVPYKGLLDDAIARASHKPSTVLMLDRGLAPMSLVAGRDIDYAELRAKHQGAQVPVEWLESNEVSYILYTSGTTGTPKGVQRDVGGYAVAMAASMKQIFDGHAGEVFFSTSDIGWVVGHSYNVYAPLLIGMGTVVYEGLPVLATTPPDAGVWWRIVEKYHVTGMFSAPTAARVLKKQPPGFMKKYDLSSLRTLYLAGEPLDESTSQWISDALQIPIIDNYWQTETGWPILGVAKGIEDTPTRLGSPGLPMPGFRVKLLNESTGAECGVNEKGVLVLEGPLPPGCLQTVYGDDTRFVKTYWSTFEQFDPPQQVYSTFDWGIRDADGYYFILGRTDDVINVAGHRLGTREIEESISSYSNVSEVAVVGVQDVTKGQVAVAFVILKDADAVASREARQEVEAEIMALVAKQIGALGRPARVHFVAALPKTRSGKLLRRSIQALCEGRDPGDLTAIEDPDALQQIKAAWRLE